MAVRQLLYFLTFLPIFTFLPNGILTVIGQTKHFAFWESLGSAVHHFSQGFHPNSWSWIYDIFSQFDTISNDHSVDPTTLISLLVPCVATFLLSHCSGVWGGGWRPHNPELAWNCKHASRVLVLLAGGCGGGECWTHRRHLFTVLFYQNIWNIKIKLSILNEKDRRFAIKRQPAVGWKMAIAIARACSTNQTTEKNLFYPIWLHGQDDWTRVNNLLRFSELNRCSLARCSEFGALHR